MYKIYKLILNGDVVYIGQTKLSLKERKSYHYGKNTKLLKNSTIELIEETDDISRERYWIKIYKEFGFKLLNIRDGDGTNRNEYRELNKDKMKKYQKEYRELNKDYQKEYRELNKDKMKKYQKEYRELNKK